MDKLDFVEMQVELDQVQRPEFGPLLAAGKRRRTMIQSGAAAAGIAAIVVAVLVGTQLLTGSASMVPPPLPAAVSGPLRGAALPLTQPATLKELVYANEWQAYALLKTPSGDLAVGRTQDGGKSWQAWKMPSGVTTKDSATLIDVQFGQTIVVRDSPSPTETHTYLSRDGGQTWSAQKDFGAPIDRVPAGWRVDVAFPPLSVNPPKGDTRQLVAYDPDTGQAHPLRSRGYTIPPRDTNGTVEVSAGHDGSFWASTWDENHHGPPAVSTDGGATWRNGEFEPPGPGYVVTDFSDWDSYDGRSGYATVEVRPTINGKTRDSALSPVMREMTKHQHIIEPDARTMVYVTNDGGRTWQPVRQGAVTAANYGSMNVGSDGTILALQNKSDDPGGGILVASHDGGQTFAPVAGIGEVQGLDRKVSGQIMTTEEVGAVPRGRVLFTGDGTTWTQGPTPPWKYAN